MSCDLLIPYDSSCCDTSIVPDELQQITADYYGCAMGKITDYMDLFYAAEVFGNDDSSEEFANSINDFHYLYAYLVMMYWERMEDSANNPPCYSDKGVPFYVTEYNLVCIKKYFECKNTDITTLLNAFGLVITGKPDGINFMSLESAFPTTPDCLDDDEIFIVNKPI